MTQEVGASLASASVDTTESNDMETISLSTDVPTQRNEAAAAAASDLVSASKRHSLPSLMDSMEEEEEVEESSSSNEKEKEEQDKSSEENNNSSENNKNASTDGDTATLLHMEQEDEQVGQKRPRRRHTISSDTSDWNGFVRKGAKIKTLVDHALAKVGLSAKKQKRSHTQEASPPPQPKQPRNEAAEKIAKEQTAQVMMLKMKLKEAEAEAAAMSATNATLREAASASSERMERTVEALKIAGTNAANARADADSAEANAAALSTQLQALKSVVDETKRASQILHTEHEQVTQATRSLEVQIQTTQTENASLKQQCRRLEEEQTELQRDHETAISERKSLETRVENVTQELTRLQHTLQEREAVDQARLDRTHVIEKELRETRALLVEASAASADTETTTALLNNTIDGLRKENLELHEKIKALLEQQRKDQDGLQEQLAKTESEAQQLRIKAAADKDEMDRLVLDKASHEETIAQLKLQITQLKRGNSTTTAVLGDVHSENKTPDVSSLNNKSAKKSVTTPKTLSIPTLGGSGKENRAGNKNTICCICYKEAFGLMKSCQCGKKDCNKRAHSVCLTSGKNVTPSVSHPGTPAPRLPVVLCSNTTTPNNNSA